MYSILLKQNWFKKVSPVLIPLLYRSDRNVPPDDRADPMELRVAGEVSQGNHF